MRKYSYGKDRRLPKKKMLGILSIGVGFIALLYFFFPLISYHMYLSSAFAGNDIQAPIPQRFVLRNSPGVNGLFSTGISGMTSNFKDARSWFPQVKTEKGESKVDEYQISIPSQKIENAKVSADDFDLSKHLVQYFTTSKNPIDKGTSVIFGHSTLPQWFNPKDYTTIFATLHQMKNGDDVIVTVDGQDYIYKVFAISVVDADDPSIFSQAFDNSYLTIITCTPPGTTWKRLVIRTSLQGMAKS